MANEYLVRQTIKMFTEIVVKLINPEYKFPRGGEPQRIVATALERLEKRFGSASVSRIADYVICSAYAFKDRGSNWKLNQVFGPKSLERFNTDKGRRYYEDKWLQSEGLTRNDLMKHLVSKSGHPLSRFVYLPSEESTKLRLLNQEMGYVICQSSTLGWTPVSESCQACKFADRCKTATSKRYPEIYRLRIEYGN